MELHGLWRAGLASSTTASSMTLSVESVDCSVELISGAGELGTERDTLLGESRLRPLGVESSAGSVICSRGINWMSTVTGLANRLAAGHQREPVGFVLTQEVHQSTEVRQIVLAGHEEVVAQEQSAKDWQESPP